MTDVNLIPADYLEQRRIRCWLRRFGLALVALAALTLAGRAWLALRLPEERRTANQMREQVKLTLVRQSQMSELDARKKLLEYRLATLHTLRDDAPWVAMFQAIDHAYNNKLWFDELTFARSLQTDSAPLATRVIAQAGRGEEQATLPRVVYGFDIKGHALDHAALGEFMRTISEQPTVGVVRLTDTGLRKYSTMEVVDFGLAATLDSSRAASR